MGADDDRLSRSAIVTGAAGGIGRAIAVRLARDGLALTVVDLPRAAHQLGDLVAQLTAARARAVAATADVSVAEEVEAAVAGHVEAHGGLDVMVANAGIAVTAPLLDTTDEQWQRTIEVNLRGVFNCYRAAARQMVSQGRGGQAHRRRLGRLAPRRQVAGRLLGFQVRRTWAQPVCRPGTGRVRHHGQRLQPRRRRHRHVAVDRPGYDHPYGRAGGFSPGRYGRADPPRPSRGPRGRCRGRFFPGLARCRLCDGPVDRR